MQAFLHLIKVPAMLFAFTFLAAFAWFKTRGVTLMEEARAKAAAAQKLEEGRIAQSKLAMAEMTRRELGPPLPSIEGWSIAEVESTHGQARHKDKATGWAVWPTFKAHFTNGNVDAVEALELGNVQR